MATSAYNAVSGVLRDQPVHSELELMTGQLAQLKQQLRASQRLISLGTAAAMLAHEYNNQMTPVVGYARSAADGNDMEFMRKALKLTLKHCATVTAMSDRILGLATDASASFTSLLLRPAVDEALACLGRDLDRDGITVKIDVSDSLRVWADPKQLQQVFFNLFLNAREAMTPGGGRLSVKAEAVAPDTVRIEVADTGCGISPDQLGDIFDPFVSSKTPAPGQPRQGHGLGLAICKDILRDHRGDICVESQKGAGTTFIITLPASD